ncbi:hypothetical protein PV721_40740 [Streptomyces sp. MB09-01]|uniref:hypothetical protein n=1 Tax=Streptomyces sp. MB09-01 TaxID=3028666 RepID=UPI0029BAD3B6|nr:hypothetical protein [Streptomyces sp. MB09-01]MDX3540518.1 hypothetical protein [Streptomyces sp. MB09-01]
MKKTLMAALATSVMAVMPAVPATPAAAVSAFCNQTTPSTSLLGYNKDTGAVGTGTLSAGRWRYGSNIEVPDGYTHGVASRDSMLFYNADTGAGESGTFKGGKYTRVQTYDNFSTGWTNVVASGDSALFYNADNGQGGTGILKNGRYQHVRSYDNFSTGWESIAASCDTAVFTKPGEVGYGTLKGGVYTHVNGRGTEDLGTLVATKDTVLALADNGSGLRYRIATATDGRLGRFRDIGTSGMWQEEGRTSDSLIFYKTDGTAWTSKLSRNTYANVGPLAGVSSGWTFFAGGV